MHTFHTERTERLHKDECKGIMAWLQSTPTPDCSLCKKPVE